MPLLDESGAPAAWPAALCGSSRRLRSADSRSARIVLAQ